MVAQDVDGHLWHEDRTAATMTTDSPVHRTRSGRSVHVQRALKLLYAGLIGGVAAAIASMIVFAALEGSRGLWSAGLGAAMVLFFYAAGQLVMVAFADATARQLMLVSMVSYTGRIVLLGALLMVINLNRENWTSIHAMAVFITAVAVVVGWLVVEVFVFGRLRIGIYDEPNDSSDDSIEQPTDDADEQDHLRPTTNGTRDAG